MKKLIVANWKMNPESLEKAKKIFNWLDNYLLKQPAIFQNSKIIICPPFIYLGLLKKKSKIEIGAQNCFFEEKGAFTGEISPKMLKNLGCKYVIVGHSERRRIFKERDEMINKKIKIILRLKLKPILCLGETARERRSGKTFEILEKQLNLALKEIKKREGLILAYEPVWAIGTGISCSSEKASEVLTFLRKKIKKIPILYGGSVSSKNAKSYIEVGFDGLLIGGASLRKEFLEIIDSVFKFISKKKREEEFLPSCPR